MTNSDATKADTAFYGVDVDAQGTIIAAGMTYESYLIANDQGISISDSLSWTWSSGTDYTPILHLY